MTNDPNTPDGRAEMLKRSRQQRADADDDYEVETWSRTIDDIQKMQRDAGDRPEGS